MPEVYRKRRRRRRNISPRITIPSAASELPSLIIFTPTYGLYGPLHVSSRRLGILGVPGHPCKMSIRLESDLIDIDGSAIKEIVLYFQTRSTNMKNRVIGSGEEYLANSITEELKQRLYTRMYVYVYMSLFYVCSSGRLE